MEDMQVKFGLKNKDFEYIKNNKIDKIIIQSTRDPGFRFIVTDQRTISTLYDILSSAKAVTEKSSLDPDYTFEMYEGESNVYKFNYITGLENKDTGNLYSDNKTYIVSKRIDNDIISNLWNLRKPRDFQIVYYNSLMEVLKKYKSDIDKGGKIGIDFTQDIDVLKYIYSINLEQFKTDIKSVLPNADLVKNNKDDFDETITVKTIGYKTDKYRSMITVYNKKDQSEHKYYTGCDYDNSEWAIRVDTKAFEAK
jgi:hypothetical protein